MSMSFKCLPIVGALLPEGCPVSALCARQTVKGRIFRRWTIVFIALTGCLITFNVSAAISVTNATLVPKTATSVSASEENEVRDYVLSANAVIELNQVIENGLYSGVPLFFNATLKITRTARWWLDRTVFSQTARFSLVYYELTRHYRVTGTGQMESRNFRSLLDALDYIGTLRNLPVQLSDTLRDEHSYIASLNLTLDEKSLPLALQPFVFVGSAWRLHSEDYSWPIN